MQRSDIKSITELATINPFLSPLYIKTSANTRLYAKHNKKCKLSTRKSIRLVCPLT